MSLLPCYRYHPAGVNIRVSQISNTHAVFALRLQARPPGLPLSGPPMRSLSLRPGNSLTSLKEALSMGFRHLVSLLPAIQATGILTLPLTGLTPAETRQPYLDAQSYVNLSIHTALHASCD